MAGVEFDIDIDNEVEDAGDDVAPPPNQGRPLDDNEDIIPRPHQQQRIEFQYLQISPLP